MKRFHPFYTIGTAGMILVAGLHLFFAVGLSISSVHPAFFGLYATFLAFLVLGVAMSIKRQKHLA